MDISCQIFVFPADNVSTSAGKRTAWPYRIPMDVEGLNAHDGSGGSEGIHMIKRGPVGSGYIEVPRRIQIEIEGLNGLKVHRGDQIVSKGP